MTNSELYDLVLTRPDQGFEKVMEKYRRPLMSFIFSRLFHYQQTEDIFQETLLRAFSSTNALRNPNQFFSWLCGIAVNVLREYYRANHKTVLIRENLMSAQKTLSREDLLFCQMIEGISDSHKQVLILKYQEGYDYHEISDMLDIPRSTVKSRLFEARKCLRKIYQGGDA